jgi:hypothetical protein
MSKCTNVINTKATVPVPIFLTLEIRQIPVIRDWIDVKTFGVLDIALSSYIVRELWLITLKSITCKAVNEWHHSHSSMRWMMRRSLFVTHIVVGVKHRDEVSDFTFEPADINGGPASCGEGVRDDRKLSPMWQGCERLESIDLSSCRRMTDIGVSALGSGCSHLQTIDLSQCYKVRDGSISIRSWMWPAAHNQTCWLS